MVTDLGSAPLPLPRSLALSLSPRAVSRSLADSLPPPCSLPRTLSLPRSLAPSPPLLPLESTAPCRRRASRLYSVDHLRAPPNWALVAAAGVLYSEVGFGRIVATEERILLHIAHTTPHTTLYLNKNREATRQRKLRPSGELQAGVRLHCRFRNGGTECASASGIK
jgi:hypothetical protein